MNMKIKMKMRDWGRWGGWWPGRVFCEHAAMPRNRLVAGWLGHLLFAGTLFSSATSGGPRFEAALSSKLINLGWRHHQHQFEKMHMRSRWPCSPRSYSSWPELFGVPEVSSTLRQASFEKCVLVTLLFAVKIIPLKLIQPSQARTKDFKKAWKYIDISGSIQRNWDIWFSCKQTALYQNFMEFCCFMLLPIFERFTYFFCSKDSQAGTRSLLPGPAGASAQRVKEELPEAIGAYRPKWFAEKVGKPWDTSVFSGLGMFVGDLGFSFGLGVVVFVRRCSGKLQIQKTCYQQLLSYEAFFPGNTIAQD